MTTTAATIATLQAAHDHALAVMIAADQAACALDMYGSSPATWYEICEARRVAGVATLDFLDAREALQAARGDA
jgi:hypothetical protein